MDVQTAQAIMKSNSYEELRQEAANVLALRQVNPVVYYDPRGDYRMLLSSSREAPKTSLYDQLTSMTKGEKP